MPKLPLKTCPHCKKSFSNKGVYAHMKYHCPDNKHRTSRSYKHVPCPKCKKSIHEKALAIHLYTQHAEVRRKTAVPSARPFATTNDKRQTKQQAAEMFKEIRAKNA